MDVFLALFVFGSLWWFVVTIAFVIWAFILSEGKSLAWVVISITAYVVFLSYLGKVNVISYFFFHPVSSLLYLIGCTVIGFLWSFVKWWLLVNEIAERVRKERVDFFKLHCPDEKYTPETDFKKMISKKSGVKLSDEWISYTQFKSDLREKPEVLKYIKKIRIWVIFWPFSLLRTFVKDFVRKLVDILIIRFNGLYDKVTNSAFKGL